MINMEDSYTIYNMDSFYGGRPVLRRKRPIQEVEQATSPRLYLPWKGSYCHTEQPVPPLSPPTKDTLNQSPIQRGRKRKWRSPSPYPWEELQNCSTTSENEEDEENLCPAKKQRIVDTNESVASSETLSVEHNDFSTIYEPESSLASSETLDVEHTDPSTTCEPARALSSCDTVIVKRGFNIDTATPFAEEHSELLSFLPLSSHNDDTPLNNQMELVEGIDPTELENWGVGSTDDGNWGDTPTLYETVCDWLDSIGEVEYEDWEDDTLSSVIPFSESEQGSNDRGGSICDYYPRSPSFGPKTSPENVEDDEMECASEVSWYPRSPSYGPSC
ncbi:hypothetical protein QBC41DRAFT_346441 [Cercophora samala]|uniref:Uncharacterized protein n=1 Tax=Cercophora samala TaxID=330535 RepID=A0AA40DCV6_9PEZI|nr:hypothetical protein QBC41DRAFT_346441 [Cercophora samala]